MKNVWKYFILPMLILASGHGVSMGQEYSLAGTWKVIAADSCTKIVYPGTSVQRWHVKDAAGTVTFSPGGVAKLETNLQLLCGQSVILWVGSADTLKISTPAHGADRFQSFRLHFLSSTEAKIDKLYCCSRYGLAIFYDITLEKEE